MKDRVDVNVPRFNQASVAVLCGAAFVLQAWGVVTLVAVILGVTRFVGPKYGVFTQTCVRLVRPRVAGEIETEPAAPPRFAQLLGFGFLSAATLAFAVGLDVVGWTLTLVVVALAALAATTRICVGCILYQQAVRQ